MNIDLCKTQKYLNWLNTKLYLDNISSKAKDRKIYRGMVYWCHFGYNIGNELSKSTPRPCVVIQKSDYNMKSPNVIVVPITHKTASLSCIIPIETKYDCNGNIILEGFINVSSIRCISKARLADPICKLKSDELKKIDMAIMRQLDIMQHYKDLENKYEKSKRYIKTANDKIYRSKNALKEIKGLLTLEDKEIKGILKKILDKIDV